MIVFCILTTDADVTELGHLQKQHWYRGFLWGNSCWWRKKVQRNSLSYAGNPKRPWPELQRHTYSYPCRTKWNCALGSACPLEGRRFACADVRIPFWIPTVIVLLPTLWAFWVDRPYPSGACKKCGYDLRGATTNRFSECGALSK
jgi:hypothetical protein